ncbi:MAG: YbaB/EbfC family nucleoid-associated protein [Clostridia bacterium]|jgi:DNA-binding YbaB/EbfC family protein|nr:YbaB/EbfC family nucleoid-associated protein [Clostridia bacterium]MBQ4245238.1 YbaB/EbfC family nucleoid-associated protein [Clostridia bacterium]MBR6005906.1 YbaB/EbfC family nucleoid-associated protein [Clostridia bacterium]
MKARIPNQPNRGDMMKMIQDMQDNMARITEEVEQSEFVTSAGGGAVEAKVSGKHELLSLTIKPEVVDPEDTEMLEDLIMSAVNESIRKANEAMEKGMEEAKGGLGGLSIPGLF